MDTPPPPPPHGANPKTTAGGTERTADGNGALPKGSKFDILVIEKGNVGSGLVYLPDLKLAPNSFAAGVAVGIVITVIFYSVLPTMHFWLMGIKNSGSGSILLVSVALGVGGWALGRYQNDVFKSNNTNNSGNGSGDAGGAPPGGPPPHGGNGFPPGGGRGDGPGGGNDAPPGGGPRPNYGHGYSNSHGSNGGGYGGYSTPPPKYNHQQRSDVPPQGAYTNEGANPNTGSSSYDSNGGNTNQRSMPNSNTNHNPPPNGGSDRNASGWERAREETRKREEERKKSEEMRKAKEEADGILREQKAEVERKLREQRERDAKEKASREAARERVAREARELRAAKEAKEATEKKEKAEREAKEQRERAAREARERQEKAEREAREKRAQEEAARKIAEVLAQSKAAEEKRQNEAREKARNLAQARRAELDAKKKAQEEAEKKAAQAALGRERPVGGSSYAYSSTGEKTNPWPKGYPTAPASASADSSPQPRATPGAASAAAAARAKAKAQSRSGTTTPTPRASPTKESPTKRTGTESEYSYRPYDTPRHKKSAPSIFSESSYAASEFTAQTTPPASTRGRYTTKDPDKIILKAAYCFKNAFQKVPEKQLLPLTAGNTDGLILRITTEGIFIDDDLKAIPLREWDLRTWTLKLVEVWCPTFSSGFKTVLQAQKEEMEAMKRKLFGTRHSRGDMIKDIGLSDEQSETLLKEWVAGCAKTCRRRLAPTLMMPSLSSPVKGKANAGVTEQVGQTKMPKLHLIRATLNNLDGGKYVFVVSEEEGWKIPSGLERLRKSGMKKVGITGLGLKEAAAMMTSLGWA